MMRTSLTTAVFLFMLAPAAWAINASTTVHVYKSPTCGCCEKWIDRMREAGFKVIPYDVNNVAAQKTRLGVPLALGSCHTAEISGYFIEGHVPPDDVKRFLAEKPEARGLDVPGMPASAPGMNENTKVPYEVLLVKKDGSTQVYARH